MTGLGAWLVQMRGSGSCGQDSGQQRGAAARVRVPAQQAVPRWRLGRELPLLPGQGVPCRAGPLISSLAPALLLIGIQHGVFK